MVEAIIGLLAGLGSLLIGFKLLSDNIEKLATSGLKKLFKKSKSTTVTKNGKTFKFNTYEDAIAFMCVKG